MGMGAWAMVLWNDIISSFQVSTTSVYMVMVVIMNGSAQNGHIKLKSFTKENGIIHFAWDNQIGPKIPQWVNKNWKH